MALSFVDIYQPFVTRKEVERDTITKEQIAQHKNAQQKCQGYNVMTCNNPRCLGNYNFDHIAFFARKRFVEGCNTVTLLEKAESEREKEEIALACLLDIEDNKIRDSAAGMPATAR